jgi:hypothetical protein
MMIEKVRAGKGLPCTRTNAIANKIGLSDSFIFHITSSRL